MSDATSLSEPPAWLLSLPELHARGIVPNCLLKPFCVWSAPCTQENELYVVKIIESGSPEADIYDQLHQLDPTSPNHTLPCDVIRSAERPVLIMPYLRTSYYIEGRDLYTVFDFLYQVLEGLAFLHERCCVHMDMFPTNILISKYEAIGPYRLEKGKVYIIDFGESRRLQRGPGQQEPIRIEYAHVEIPENMKTFDPYSWDVYCTGTTFKSIQRRVYGNEQAAPWIVRQFVDWVVGREERGCTGVCRCRPTARRARQVASVLRWVAYSWRIFSSMFVQHLTKARSI